MKKICIIGAGVSGLFLANIIKNQAEFDYKIIEKRPNFNFNEGYGIQLSVNSIKLLNNIGFKNLPESEVYLPKKVNFFQAQNSKKICDIDLSQFNNNRDRYTTLKRSKLIEFLLENIPSEKIVLNSDLIEIKNEDKLLLNFRDKKSEEFDCLVAADGIYSKTRQILFKKDAVPKYFNSIALRGNIRNFENFDISLYLGSNFHFVIYPVNQNKEFNFISIIRKELIQEEISNKNLFKDNNFINNLLNQISNKSNLNLIGQVEDIKCYPIFVSKKVQIPQSKNIFLIGDAFYSFPPSFAQGASQSIEAANELFNDLKNNSSNYYKTRILKTKQINSRSLLNHFTFHLSNPLNIFFRDIILKYLSKNKNFLENFLGKIYNN